MNLLLPPRTTESARAGVTLLELLIATSILAGVLVAALSTFGREGEALQAITNQTQVSLRGQHLIGRLDALLGDAQPILPDAWLTEDVDTSQNARFLVDTHLGFPDRGFVILEPGTLREEHVSYASLGSTGGPRLLNLERGLGCTTAAVHSTGARVLWAGIASVIPQQIAPPSSAFDGSSLERGEEVFFRGDGTGFSFRVPTDPTGGNNVLNGLDVQWGATLRGQPLATARCAFVFEVTDEISEAELEQDLDRDGNLSTIFDLGEVHLRIWDTADSGLLPQSVSLGGTRILQRQCDHGGDLDNDGYDDPMFLWTPESGRLRVRLFLLSHRVGQPAVVTRQEATLRLRNPPAS